MPRDYAKNQHRERQPIPGWLWMLAGLIIGLFIALLVFIKENSTGKTLVPDTVSKIFQSKQDTRSVRQETPQAPPPAPVPATQTPAPARPKFDFYTILPELEVAIPEQEIQERTRKPAEPGNREHYILQAGSFREMAAADRLKAQLALQGIEAHIQVIQANGADTWHRVRIGPLDDIQALNTTRQRLSKLGIASIVVKDKK